MARRGYHHGNLRRELIEATLALVEEKGPTGFTLSEAAKAAGATPPAVYRHFEGREDMIAAAALEGYRIFADLMEHAYDGAAGSALGRFNATGRAYLAFARRFPGHYICMFESGVSIQASADLAAESSRAFGVLERAAAELTAHIPKDRRPPARMVSAHVWAMSHGVVELFARGSPGTKAPFPAEDLLESGVGVYLRGLGLIAEDA